jgi:uncharacterized protein (TIGR00255 family)
MTGFARAEAVHPWGTLSCEIRSVNHRYLELQLRVPEALRHAEHASRELLRERLGRGKVDCSLRLQDSAGAEGGVLRVDEDRLAQLLPPNLTVGVVQSVNEQVVPAPDAVVQLSAPVDAIDWVQVVTR